MALFGQKNRKRRIVELILAVSFVALVIWILRPYREREDSERAARQAQAQAIVEGATDGISSFAEAFPVAFGQALLNPYSAQEIEYRRLTIEVDTLSRELKKSPDDINRLLQRARALRTLGDDDSAMVDFDRILALEPKNAEALNDRAYLVAERGEFAAALPQAELAVRLSPNKDYILDTLAFVYVGLERDDEAVALYRKILKIDPTALHASWGLAAALRRQGKTAEAQKLFDEVKAIDPNYCLHWQVDNDPGHHPKRT